MSIDYLSKLSSSLTSSLFITINAAALRVALAAHYEKETNNRALVQTAKAA